MAKKSLKERMAERREELNSRGGGFDFILFTKEGTYRLRHLPVGEEQEPLIEIIYVYLNKDLGGFISPRTWGKPCAFLEASEELKNSKSEADQKFGKALAGRKNFAGPAIKYKDEKGTEIDMQTGVKPVLLKAGQYQQLIDLYLDDENGDFTDPIKGYDIKHKRTGMGMQDTRYTLTVCKPRKLPKEFRGPYNIEEMLQKLTPTYKETKIALQKFLHIKDEDDEELPKKNKSSSISDVKKKKKNRDL